MTMDYLPGGPWVIQESPDPYQFYIVDAMGAFVAVGAQADARLIAAAPDLLAALQTLVSECESMGRASHTSARIDRAHAAIARATEQEA